MTSSRSISPIQTTSCLSSIPSVRSSVSHSVASLISPLSFNPSIPLACLCLLPMAAIPPCSSQMRLLMQLRRFSSSTLTSVMRLSPRSPSPSGNMTCVSCFDASSSFTYQLDTFVFFVRLVFVTPLAQHNYQLSIFNYQFTK